MSDVFISYASEDRDQADRLASAFEALGWSVWWDRKIIAGQTFDHVIERELDTAKCVVVLWSAHSVASEWVRNEAAVASERGVLVPGMIETVKLPLEFRRKQTADLTGWQGETSHRGLQALCAGVSAALGDGLSQATGARSGEKSQRPSWWPSWGWAAMAAAIVVVVVVGLVAYEMRPGQTLLPKQVGQSERLPPQSPPKSGATTGGQGVGQGGTFAGPADLGDLANRAVGTYDGDVISDSKGNSRTDISLTVTRIDRLSVRVTSEIGRAHV